MAKKIKPPASAAKSPAPATNAAAADRPAKSRLTLMLVIVCIALSAVAFFSWRWFQIPARVQSTLLPPPDLTGKPAIQAALLAKAHALTKSPGTAWQGVIELGRLYHANGYRNEAEACWRLLHEEQPHEARWTYYLADLRRAASDYPALTSLLAETVALAPGYSPAWLQLAGLEFKAGQFENAQRHYQRRLELVPNDPYAILGLARIAQQNKRPEEARKLVGQLVHDAPQFSTGHNLYAEILAAAGDAEGARKQRWLGRETGRFREAEDPWLEELHAWCYDFGRLCVLATIEQQTERGDKAKSLIERAIAVAPENPVGYELLGSFYRKIGEHTKARDAFENGLRAAKTVKPSPMFYVNLSETYRLLKQPDEALRVVQLGLREAGDQLELHDALGVALADLKRQDEAVAAFKEVLARSPNDSNSNYNLGMSLLVLGRQEEAYAAFKRSLVLQPTFLKALSFLSRWELEAGRLEAAGNYLQPLYESHPEIPEVRQMMVQWHLRSASLAEKNRDGPSAEKHYRAGIEIDPARPELQVGLGVYYLLQNRIPEALPPLESFHKLKPSDPQSSLFLGQVYLRLGRMDDARRILTEGEQLAKQSGNATTAAHFREILQLL